MLAILFGALLSYLVGAVPFGYLAGRWMRGIDIREVGSGNLGATNVARELGMPAGVAVFLFDAFKGYACAGPLAGMLVSSTGTTLEGGWIVSWGSHPAETLGLLFGLLAVLGHLFPAYLGFRGGKGVATGLGLLLALVPVAAALSLGVWALVLAITRYVAVASCIAASFVPIWLLLRASSGPAPRLLVVFSALIAVLVWIRHRSNFVRLARGEEDRVGRGAPGSSSG